MKDNYYNGTHTSIRTCNRTKGKDSNFIKKVISRLSKTFLWSYFRYILSLSFIVNSHFDLASQACFVCYKLVKLIFSSPLQTRHETTGHWMAVLDMVATRSGYVGNLCFLLQAYKYMNGFSLCRAVPCFNISKKKITFQKGNSTSW